MNRRRTARSRKYESGYPGVKKLANQPYEKGLP